MNIAGGLNTGKYALLEFFLLCDVANLCAVTICLYELVLNICKSIRHRLCSVELDRDGSEYSLH